MKNKNILSSFIVLTFCCLLYTQSLTAIAKTSLPKRIVLDFSSGAGGWYTEVNVKKDGTFTGHYQDMDMGDSGTKYPNGTMYYSDFSGSFTDIQKKSDNQYTLTLSKLTYAQADQTSFKDGIRYISSLPYGIEKGKSFVLYCPGYKISKLPQNKEAKGWYHMYLYDTKTDYLKGYMLYNQKPKYVFYGE